MEFMIETAAGFWLFITGVLVVGIGCLAGAKKLIDWIMEKRNENKH